MPKLTKRIVEATDPRAKDYFVWDDAVPGFGLRVRPSGRRSFILQYRTPETRQRRRVLGHFPILTVDQARRVSMEWLSSVYQGKDPADAADRNRAAASVAQLCEQFISDHATLHKKAKSIAEDRRIIQAYLIPAFGSRRGIAISHTDVERLHRSLRATPYQANRVVALLSAVFNFADVDLRNARPDWINPCQNVRRYREEKRRRYLSAAELAKLGEALATAEAGGLAPSQAVAAIRLLIFTGCRRNEILTLKWHQLNFERQALRLEDSKTGPKDVYLSPPALELLRRLEPQDGNPYVIPGRVKGTHLRDLKFSWKRICALAELEDIRIHDLRHSFASVGVGVGLSLPVLGALLGHAHPATTARYAHLAADPLQQAVNLVGQELESALSHRDETASASKQR